MRHSIDSKLLEKILNYMASKPFNEVASLILEAQKDIKAITEEPTQDTSE